jgi:hypothetical protein
MLVQNLNVRILNAATGELLRELVTDPARDYQPRLLISIPVAVLLCCTRHA